MPDNRRVFFALWPGAEQARQFDAAGCLAQAAFGGRRMRRETLHLTLAFVGDVAADRLPVLRDVAGAIRLPPFALRFERLECRHRRRIAWAAAAVPPELRDLADALAAGLRTAQFPVEERPFVAHVTLLRHADCASRPPAGGLRIEWPVRDFVLVESELRPEGARYCIDERWPLA
ncbi:MAG: RNA 2',3'-cyclic phosphodiesterase [Rhodocyclaceae bacterium]|nr:MAG: RNA 2',3'-cyclic phosphodiesterase [Rhodocyclaceae bacterium]